jgi:hypothetical protein
LDFERLPCRQKGIDAAFDSRLDEAMKTTPLSVAPAEKK